MNFRLYMKILAVVGVSLFAACEVDDPVPPKTRPNPNITLSDLRKVYEGQAVRLEPKLLMDAHQVAGVVISDAAAGNIGKGEFIIQNTQRGIIGGITLSLGEGVEASYALGDSLVIDVVGSQLTRVNGELKLADVSPSMITKLREDCVVEPRPVTLQELITNFDLYEGTLVRVIGTTITPPPVEGETYEGNKILDDGADVTIQLHTESNAAFAGEKLPTNAEFTGIARYHNASGNDVESAEKQLWMRNLDDAGNASGPLYPGFPEKFDTDLVKDAYASADLDISTGNWTFNGVTLVTLTSARPINPDGTKGVQFNQRNSVPLFLQMNFDVPNGASKVTVLSGSYGTDPGCTWRLEYSSDGGSTWEQIGDEVSVNNKVAETVTFLMDLDGPVRFRVLKLGLGDTNNGRLNLDDFTIYQN